MNLTGDKDLPALKKAAGDAIDAAAENCRLLYITPGSGQAMAYLAKLTEAEKFLVTYPDGNAAGVPAGPDATNWPNLSAEINITAPTLWQIAEIISQQNNAWVGTGTMIEALRLTGKNAVLAATTVAQVAAAQVIAWPSGPAAPSVFGAGP